MPKAMVLAVSQIEENPNALRTVVNKETVSYEELKASIKQYGVIDSISVKEYTKEDGSTGYRLVNGLHRKTACQELGISEMSVNVITVEDEDLLATQIIANATSVKTTKSEFAKGIKQLIQLKGWTFKEVAKKLDKSEKWVRQQFDINDLPESVTKLIDGDKIALVNAVALKSLPKDKVEDYIQSAMTESPETFVPRITEIARELRAAAREGRKPNLEFKPSVKPRRTTVLKDALAEFETTGNIGEFRSLIELEAPATPFDAAVVVLKWMMGLDATSVAAQRATWEAEQKQKDEVKKLRDAERQEKKDKESKEALKSVVAEGDAPPVTA